jgi:D-alanyl-lipoteichoic acid acyltransferase DltB (MBOAT superfamily)
MQLLDIALLLGLAVAARGGGARWRGPLAIVASVLMLYHLQPGSAIRFSDFWLPTATLGLVVATWALVQRTVTRADLTWAVGLVVAGPLAVTGLRFVEPVCCLTATRPPETLSALLPVGLAAGVVLALTRLAGRAWALWAGLGLLIGVLVALKWEPSALALARAARALSGQSTELAAASELPWLGVSYFVFRLIHTVRDRMSGRLPAVSLSEFVAYTLFFPTLTAGPIDRLERFSKDWRAQPGPWWPDLEAGLTRLGLGVVKKFVIADLLALLALNTVNAGQLTSGTWAWVLVYAYALRIYFDFSGYTDVAIGLGRVLGVRVPENFDRPYLKTNLTQFWNSWHMTLALWFRNYYFNPLTRALRTRTLPTVLVIALAQLSTMALIGIWHGLTWNFAIWGLWHGLGLFVHNRWAAWLKTHPLPESRWRAALGWLLTVHFVVLGWVWFVLPTPGLALRVFEVLFFSRS